MKDDDVIQWRFGDENTLIVGINETADRITVYDDVLDGRFRDRLKLDKQTGSLTITNTRTEHNGRYELQINSVSRIFRLTVIGVFGDRMFEGDSVTLNSGLTEMKDDDVIQWRFENTLIAEINVTADRITVYDDVLDGRFRDRLKLDNQTGSLIITNTRSEHTGAYELQINSVIKSFDLYVRTLICEKLCSSGVYAHVFVIEGDPVSLNSDLTEMKDDDVVQWRFGDKNTLIAEINKRADRITVYDDVLDGRFRDRLKLDNQTGSLTITNTTTGHEVDYERRINSKIKRFVLDVYGELNIILESVMEGDSVSLNSPLTEMKDDDVIQWRFGNKNPLIAEINKQADRITVYDDVFDGRFRDRLKLDNQTGSLTITNTRTEHDGDYILLINSERKSFRRKRFILFVIDEVKSVSVKEGDSVSLNSDLTEIKDYNLIQWRFENTLIAEIYKRFDRITVYDDVLDGRFRDRLKLDNQTGSLTITNTTTEHAGDYKLLMFTDLLYSGRFSSKAFRVSVYDSVHCCGPTEAVIRLVLSALVGVATVIIVVYEIRSRRAERDQAHIHTSGSIQI
ncbi:unnamed protein product [Leuciscus chuanchicus]